MKKTTARVLTILAIFVGVMLLLVQSMVETAVAAQPDATLTLERFSANPTPITRTMPITATHPITPEVEIVGPQMASCPILEKPNCVFLPTVFKPVLLLNGRIKLDQSVARVEGLTIFEKDYTSIKLDFSELPFPELPEKFEWRTSDNPSYEDPIDYSNNPTININALDSPGYQELFIKFILQDGTITAPIPFTFFYIPNGDFVEMQLETIDTPWVFQNDKDGVNNVNIDATEQELNLYVDASHDNKTGDCNAAEVGYAKASIGLELPSTGDFYLNVVGTVFTQDQNPSNSSTFDAFEVVIDGNVADRVSNMDQPIRCNPVINRQVDVNLYIPLGSYSGQTTISLENHRRFDNQYDTYTEIDMVWIDY